MTLKRRPSLPRSSRPMKKTRLNPVNRKRRQSEFARCYHSKERVGFVKALGCVYCRMTHGWPLWSDEIHNAHTENGGRGRKGHYATIIPLCATHHRNYDEHQPPLVSDFIRGKLKEAAAEVERLWQSRLLQSEDAE